MMMVEKIMMHYRNSQLPKIQEETYPKAVVPHFAHSYKNFISHSYIVQIQSPIKLTQPCSLSH